MASKERLHRHAKHLALVGSDTLLGREIRDVLESGASGIAIDGFAPNGEPNFGEEEGAAVYREALSAETLKGCKTIVCAGSEAGAEKAYNLAKANGGVKLIDCTSYLDEKPEARICTPLIDSGISGKSWLLTPAHPAAAAIAALLLPIASSAAVERAVVDIFEPASERGSKGIAELQQQTTNLLSFRPLEKHIFDAQLSFNLLPAYGEEAPVQLAAVEQRIERHLATILARAARKERTVAPMPSLRLIQAPVFHGYSFSMWIQFEENAALEKIGQSLASPSIDLRTAGQEVPTNAESAGQSGIAVGDLRVDRNNPRAVWLWMVADNLRLLADSVASLLDGAPN
jgi:aspartate-semialdehyde dehydrogenase